MPCSSDHKMRYSQDSINVSMSSQRGHVMNRATRQDQDKTKTKSKKSGSLRYWSELQLQTLTLPKKKIKNS